MTKDEALKLALEALEADELDMVDDGSGNMVFRKEQAITAMEKLLAQPEQEPVAVKHMMRWVNNLKWQSDNGQHMNIPSGLSSGTCWELAIELEQFIKSTAPQRTWVGDLEDIDINITWNENSMRDFGKDELNFARSILRKAQEK